ncbi:hypothetical protein RFI_22177 [Reticulomyxa filosa]|uniref:Uncharacterized protein n=1 Tax=Reticulomyxa filosa TaxID=46433 RepID=X6MND8_RETFI|nr:hypothetical protein RFI_22177 [Reticulomyxa filosa]|eukprot:ETO15186.1 hypothetical protein RFI_22177 [Reticulomyxa filosa]
MKKYIDHIFIKRFPLQNFRNRAAEKLCQVLLVANEGLAKKPIKSPSVLISSHILFNFSFSLIPSCCNKKFNLEIYNYIQFIPYCLYVYLGQLTFEFEKVNHKNWTLVCCICNQIATNAMELHCDEHENVDQAYLFGEQCLQNYLKQNNGKCPIQQHEHCEFSQNKIVRKSVSELLVICPQQFELKKGQSNERVKFGEDEENFESNSKDNCNCNFKGKI